MTPTLNRLLLTAALLGGVASITAQEATPAPATATTPTPAKESEASPDTKMMELEKMTVLGSRIRRVEAEGPSATTTFGQDYIRNTGAMDLAEFLRSIPQTYGGVSSGRNSAPNEFNMEGGNYTESTTKGFNLITGNFSEPLGQTGVNGVSLRGLGSGSTLVLVDGRRVSQSGDGNMSSRTGQGFVDLNTIPLAMVERIELITDGSSALYGADATGGVINIILKKSWSGTEVTGSVKGTEHGGGTERNFAVTHGFAHGPLRGTVNLNYYDRGAVKASQRDFSKDQNYSTRIVGYNAAGQPVYGTDRRLNWAYPGVIQAVTGNLNGVLDPNGNPTRFATLKPGATGNSINDFVGLTGNFASALLRGETAEYTDLIGESERKGAAVTLNYQLKPKLELFFNYYYTDGRSHTDSIPGVSSAATSSGFGNFSTVIPSTYTTNPFGQNVAVGLLHYEFGSFWQKSNTKAHNAVLGAKGQIGEVWFWDTGFNYQKQRRDSVNRLFNSAGITGALTNADPALRINPFINAEVVGVTQAALYERLALYNTNQSEVESKSFDLNVSGEAFDIWGGAVGVAVGGTYSDGETAVQTVNNSIAVVPVVTRVSRDSSRTSHSAYGEVSLPFFGKPNAVTGIQRLETNFAGRYEDQGDSGTSFVPTYGVVYQPIKSVLLRAKFSEGFRAASLSELQVDESTQISTLTDPRRTPPSTTGVRVTQGSNLSAEPETSKTTSLGAIWEVPFISGLSLQINYYHTEQENLLQVLSAQTIVNNEAIFADRVTRAAATAADIALGQPGAITDVRAVYENYGNAVNKSLDIGADYILPWQNLGTWQLGVNASHNLEASRELSPGQPLVDDNGDTNSAPDWNFVTNVFWKKGPWNASAFVYYMSGFNTNLGGNPWTNNLTITGNMYPDMWRADLGVGYTFEKGILGGIAKGTRLRLDVGNALDEEPPFANNMFGYNGGLHGQWMLGRTYKVSISMPF